MKIQHHLDDATLMKFASGNLNEALAAVVSAHISLCDTCQEKLNELNMVGGVLLESAEPCDINPETLENLDIEFERMMAQASVEEKPELKPRVQEEDTNTLPVDIRNLVNADFDELNWKFLAPGIQTYKLPISESNGDLRLLKIKPGYALPEHGHDGSELTLVLKGSYSDKFGQFCRGDIADLDHEVEHQPIVDEGEECICLAATDKPLKFKGIVPKLLQPFIGM